jgi:hypothetical protein
MKGLEELSKPLPISQIDFRVQSINNGGYATILAYKDARVDQKRLDDSVGHLGWQRDYRILDSKLFCGVGLYDSTNDQWVWKWDVGTESNTEKEKGQASDSFKRACFNWGIGRELYDYPIINVKLRDDEWTKDGGKPRQTFNLKIKEWRWYSEFNEDGTVSYLGAKDEKGALRFQYGSVRKKEDYKPASGATDDSISTPESVPVLEVLTPVPLVESDANVDGLLKKKDESAVNSNLNRDMLAAEYKSLYGKAPHGRMSEENIQREIDNAKIPKSTPEHPMNEGVIGMFNEDGTFAGLEEEEAEMEFDLHPMQEEINKISTFNVPSEFVAWAKSTASNYADTVSEEALEEFKELCNHHYQKIK